MKYLLLSGPPRSGKDTCAGILTQDYPGTLFHERFSYPLKAAASAFGFRMHDQHKDTDQEEYGISLRQFQIYMSEDFAKPLLGNDVFGTALARRTMDQHSGRHPNPLIVVSDSGFTGEAEALAKQVGLHRVSRIHVTRPGTNFDKDSRSNWNPLPGMAATTIENDGDLVQLRERLIGAMVGLDLWPEP